MVEHGSTIIADAAERKEGVNANHRDMVKFGSLEDEGYIKIASALNRFVEDIKAQQSGSCLQARSSSGSG